MHPTVHIPRPCADAQAVLSPTAVGYHCASCRTKVIDFTRLSEAEVLAYLAARPGQRVCAVLAAPAGYVRAPAASRWPRWLLGLAALLGGARLAVAAGLPPQQAPTKATTKATLRGRVALGAPITIRGVVFDDEFNVPVAGAYVFVKNTVYGAVTNEKGEFTITFAADWEPVRKGTISLEVSASAFTFVPQSLTATLDEARHGAALLVRLKSIEGRGSVVGKVAPKKPPVAPPGAGKGGKSAIHPGPKKQ